MSEATGNTANCVLLAHGGGGERTAQLLREHILPPVDNEKLRHLPDGAVLPWGSSDLVFTTDSYVVTPIEFPGGDIGNLAVAGTVNDLAVMGAEPVAISLGLILEEGLPFDVLDRVMASIAGTAKTAGVQVVTGDTKVIERRRGRTDGSAPPDGLFINTAGIGRLIPEAKLGITSIEVGDAVVVNGTLAEHGLAIMSVRSGLEFESPLRSDVAPLNGLIRTILQSGIQVRFMRDATRGGVAGVLSDIAETRGLSVDIEEASVPVSPTARHAAEMLGLDPLAMANEGKVVCVVAAGDAPRLLEIMRGHPLGRHAACIGSMTAAEPPLVELITRAGGRRIVQRPYGEDVPRIC